MRVAFYRCNVCYKETPDITIAGWYVLKHMGMIFHFCGEECLLNWAKEEVKVYEA